MRVLQCLLFCTLMWVSACSGGGNSAPAPPSTPTAPSPPPAPPPPGPSPAPTVTITAAGFTPSEVIAAVGSRVLFVNADAVPHDLLGGPDHTRPDCAEVDVVGFLVPGQRRETLVFEAARLCDFHDHVNVGNPAFHGRIIVQ